jgi:hypothetical protein
VVVDPPASYLVAEDRPERSAVAADPEPEFVEREATRASGSRPAEYVSLTARFCPSREIETGGVRAPTGVVAPRAPAFLEVVALDHDLRSAQEPSGSSVI